MEARRPRKGQIMRLAKVIARANTVKINVPIAKLQAFVVCMLPFVAYATVTDFNDQFKGYNAATLFSLGSLIFCGTLSGMLHRLKNEYKVNDTVRHPLLFVSSDLVGGTLAGVLMVLVGFGNNFAPWLVAVMTGGGAFAGSMLIEQGWQSLAKRYLPDNPNTKLGELVAKATGAPVPSDEQAGPISKRGTAPGGDGNAGKYD